jgi:hypothetical protein
MKIKIILAATLLLMLTAGLNPKADAAPWRGGYGYCRPAVRFCPPVRVYVPPVVVGGYYGPRNCAPVYAPHYGYRGYAHGYHR